MYKFTVSLILFLASPMLACAAALTLDQCIERGMEFNPQVQAYRIAVDEADEQVYEAWGAFLPTLSADYGYTELENTGTADLDRDYLTSTTNKFQARLSQPLFTGMAGLAGLKKSRESKTYREYELQSMQQQLVREIRTSFNDILLGKRLVSKWTESVERLQNQEKIAEAWVAEEMAPHLRLLEIAVELSNARQHLVHAETGLAIAEAKLKEWINLQSDKQFTIVGSLQNSIPVSCHVAESCLEQAFNKRPELTLSELNISMAREEVKIIRARNLPRASFDASWIDYERDYDTDQLTQEKRDYYTLSLNLSVRPFQGGRNIFAYRRQLLSIKRFEYERDRRKNGIVTEVRTSLQQLLEGDSRVKDATSSVEESSEAYHFATRSVKLGVLSLEDLLTAELRLTQAEISKINAEHALKLAQIQLSYVVAEDL